MTWSLLYTGFIMRGITYTAQNLIGAKLLNLFAGGPAYLTPKIS